MGTPDLLRPPAADPGAAAVFAEIWPGLVRLGHLLTGSRSDGEDVAAEAYLGLLRAWPVDDPVAYARRSVVNGAINAGKRRRRAQPVADPAEVAPVATWASLPPADDMWPLVQRLPPRQRAVIVLRYYLDLSEADIAEALGCRPGTVKAHASKGLDRLRRELR